MHNLHHGGKLAYHEQCKLNRPAFKHVHYNRPISKICGNNRVEYLADQVGWIR